jgi:Ca2+-transporting ATPase
MEKEEVLSIFETSDKGLNSEEVQKRINKFGKNLFKNSEKKTAVNIFFEQLSSPLIFILIGAAVVTFFLNEWIEFITISFAVLINTGLGFYREYHAEHTLEKLETFIKDRTRVVRGGIEQEIDSELIVPGDIIKLSYGNRIPADARLLSVNNLRVDESLLTGEAIPVYKNLDTVSVTAPVADRTNMIHAGTLISEGFASAVVASTGSTTQIGNIANLVSGTNRAKTPIQKGFSRLAWLIFLIVLVIVITIFILGIFRGEPILEMLVLSAAVSVGAVPEALPIALTVILSNGAERIASKKGVTRNLMAAETLGSTSLIMTDKTGTLTEANMKLVGVYRTDEISGEALMESIDDDDKKLLKIAILNVDVLVENPEDKISSWIFKGKPFEVNIAKTARDIGIDVESLRNRNVSSLIIPFNSVHKFSVSIQGNKYIIMGAPDILLANSAISKEEYQKIESWILTASNEGKRLIAIATLSSSKKDISAENISDCKFLGVLAFNDPIRKEVPKSIKRIESLGVKVVMITGDLKGTAVSVAKDIGWEIVDSNILTGSDLKQLSDEQLLPLLPSIKIFARVTPEDKLRVGSLYRSLGEVVAMTGDGVNDAPALKAMDIGVALGSGSDVAKSAAGLVLLDDNFQIISSAIIEGRRILSNIRKTFVYLMSNSLDEVFVIGGSLLFALPLPLTALQIIWVNLFTGSLPALAFAYDEDFDHDKSSKEVNKSLFSGPVKFLTFGIGIVSSLLLFVLYYFLIKLGVEISIARSVFFICFASYILVVAYSFRSLKKPLFSYPTFSNKKLNYSIALAFTLIVMTMIIPVIRNLFDLSAVPFVWIWFVLGWLLLNIALVEGAKYFFRRHHRVNV